MKAMEIIDQPAGDGDEDEAVLRLGGCIVYRHRHHRDVLGGYKFNSTCTANMTAPVTRHS